MSTIRTPDEIAESNRIKDEQIADALVPQWIQKAKDAIEEYRSYGTELELPRSIRGYPRFVKSLYDTMVAICEPAGWEVRLYDNPLLGPRCPKAIKLDGNLYEVTHIAFLSKPEVIFGVNPDIIHEPPRSPKSLFAKLLNAFFVAEDHS